MGRRCFVIIPIQLRTFIGALCIQKAKKSIAALTDLAPKMALLKTGNDLREVKIEELKPGDVIVQLGEQNVQSLEQYMKALGDFKKGDKTTVHFNRVNEKLSASIEF
jgi:PDZ domain-containing secreted protein